MANKNALNKNSVYVQSLVDFVLDTKPYHSKLTEIVEEYRFFDDVNVSIKERFASKTKINPTWMYNYFSSATPQFRTMPAKRAVSPSFSPEVYTVGRDENTDLANVPYVYSKRGVDGPGVNAVYIRHEDFTEPLTESVDYFRSQGSFQFQIKQTTNANGDLDPLWSLTTDDGAIMEARRETRVNALDSREGRLRDMLVALEAELQLTSAISAELASLHSALNNWAFPDLSTLFDLIDENALLAERELYYQEQYESIRTKYEAIDKIRALLDEIQIAVNSIGGHREVQMELTGDIETNKTGLYQIINNADLPNSYEALLAWLAIPNELDLVVPLEAPHDRQWFEQQFSINSSPLFFGKFTDLGVRESGKLVYPVEVESPHLKVTNITASADNDIEEWTLKTVDRTSLTYRVTGSSTGFLGFVTAGDQFRNTKLNFDTEYISRATNFDTLTLTPTKKLVIGANAPLETWNVIKVSPLAHSRPQLTSARFGHIRDANGVIGQITIKDISLPTGDIILTARGDGQFFDLTSPTSPGYTAVITIGQMFEDDYLKFMIVNGTLPFRRGERFYISIVNEPPQIRNLDIGFGYDLDPYDDDETTYTSPDTRPLGFGYDGRFTDFDFGPMNFQITQNAVHGRKFRIVAQPDTTRVPPATGAFTKLIETIYDNPVNPADPGAQLQIFYASSFKVEYSDDDFATVIPAGPAPFGVRFDRPDLGIAFTIEQPSKPYVACIDMHDDNRVIGGDVFSFEVVNPEPRLVETNIGLSSLSLPRLLMHSDNFFDAPMANWTVAFLDDHRFTISAVSKSGEVVVPTTEPVDTSLVGHSFKGLGIHFTFVPAAGVADGDKFTFETFAEKPTYLVHGSASGWAPPATIGKYYWNGKIGFKIPAPTAETFVSAELTVPVQDDPPNTKVISVATKIDLDFTYTIREDCPSLTYSFVQNTRNNTTWIVTRSDIGVPTFVSQSGIFKDKYLTADMTGVTEPSFKLVIDAHDLTLWNSAEVVILHPAAPARLPEPDAEVIIEKTEDGRIELNLVAADQTRIADLGPLTIDQRFIDTNTRGIPLVNTSPETALLQGWIPMNSARYDIGESTAEFSDPVTRYLFTSAISGETIGTLKQQDSLNLNEPIIFEWDAAFYDKYLPLNAEANITITDPGWNDRIRVQMTESVKFLLGGGALEEDWMFRDSISVNVTEFHGFKIKSSYEDSFSTDIADGPFDGFLPGFDNLPFDAEDGGAGSYDPGQPPDFLSLLDRYQISEQERKDVFDRWNHFLQSPNIPSSEEQWEYLRNALLNDPNVHITRTTDFGIPLIGMGMDITDRPVNPADTQFQDSMVSLSSDEGNRFDMAGYGVGELDAAADVVAVTYSGSLPIAPTDIGGATYETLNTALELPVAAAKHYQTALNTAWVFSPRLKGRVIEVTTVAKNAANETISPINVQTVQENGDITMILTFAEPATGRATAVIQTFARVFEITITAADNTPEAIEDLNEYTPTFSIWLPSEPAPTQIQVVERLEPEYQLGQLIETDFVLNPNQELPKPSRLFRFSFARPTEGKVIVG